MIQIMGKYLNLPYWRLLPNGTPDPLIIDNVTADFYSMDNTQKIIKIQECLALNGYSVALNGVLDDNTVTALKDFKAKHPEATGNIDKATFLALYSSIPISRQSISRRKMLVRGEVPVNAAAIDTPAGHSEPTSSSGGVPAKKDSSINVAGSLDNILRLTTNSTSYRIGDEMKIFFEASKPLHIRVVSYSSSGEIATLFPNQYQSDNLIKSRKKYQIPPIEAPFTLHVAGPAGVDKIMAIGSERPFPPNFNPITEQGEFTQEVTQSYPILVKTTININ
jgi:hypothetical protein